MPSKYFKKIPKPQTRQGFFNEKSLRPRCTNCGREAYASQNLIQFSKCYCGGTFQTYGVKNV